MLRHNSNLANDKFRGRALDGCQSRVMAADSLVLTFFKEIEAYLYSYIIDRFWSVKALYSKIMNI
jgi:hypothetical protein